MKKGDKVIVFNDTEWRKTGDLPEGNRKYFQKANILKFRISKRNEKIVDVLFCKTNKRSNGHFLSGVSSCL